MMTDIGRSGADAPSGSRPTDGAQEVSTADAASIPNAAMYVDLAAAETEAAREATGLHDWHYRDLPQLSPEFFDKFVALVGEENLRWLTFAERHWPDGSTSKRGQVMVSPEGMARVAVHNAASAIEARSDATGTGAAEGESAAPQEDAR